MIRISIASAMLACLTLTTACGSSQEAVAPTPVEEAEPAPAATTPAATTTTTTTTADTPAEAPACQDVCESCLSAMKAGCAECPTDPDCDSGPEEVCASARELQTTFGCDSCAGLARGAACDTK